MFCAIALLGDWQLEADELPDRLIPLIPAAGFTLPGADALARFADLLGETQEEDAPVQERAKSVPFSLPAMFPRDVRGRAALSREIDFGRLNGKRAVLTVDCLCGRGTIELGGRALCRFGEGNTPAQVALNVTDALRLGRKQRLSLRFDDAAGAGVPGAVMLRTTDAAYLTSVSLRADPLRRTLGVAAEFTAVRRGSYVLRAALACPGDAQKSPWRETQTPLAHAGKGVFSLSLTMPAPRFSPGIPYAAPTLKLTLYYREEEGSRRMTLLDSVTRQTGYAGFAPKAYLPLTPQECRLNPDALLSRAKELGIYALFLPAPAPDLLYLRATQEGVALLPYMPKGAPLSPAAQASPCSSPLSSPDPQAFDRPSLAESSAALCAMPSLPARPFADSTDEELFFDAFGRRINPDDKATLDPLRSLRTLLIRLRAEAARQGQYSGALCAAGEWDDEAICAALRAAFAPTHLSALPLRGAWWSLSQFSASLHAFLPADAPQPLTAEAVLEAADGSVLARVQKPCPPGGGSLGLLSCPLPETACVLSLRTRLLCEETVLEESVLPVYVGERGPLEAAI